MSTPGQHDVLNSLIMQHQQIRQLFRQAGDATGVRKRELFEDLVRLLAVHDCAEEQVVHPQVRDVLPTGDHTVDERLAEENGIKQALADLYDLGVTHPDFEGRLAALEQSVLDHILREERDEFPALRQHLSPDQLAWAAGALEKAEQVAPTRPHPGTGESALGNMLAGPPLAIFDHVRDGLREWIRDVSEVTEG